mgnify:CR=1 FL=1
MSDLRPHGVKVSLDGVERHLLFTLNAVDEIQEHFELPLPEVMQKLIKDESSFDVLKDILIILFNDEVERLSYAGGKCELEKVDERQIGWMLTENNVMEAITAVLLAYGCDLPDPDSDDPNVRSGTQKR